jgi:hypothetical protein
MLPVTYGGPAWSLDAIVIDTSYGYCAGDKSQEANQEGQDHSRSLVYIDCEGYNMLYFDEASHTYKLDDRILKSVSQIVASQFRRFNAYVVAANLEKTRANDEESPYYGMKREEIMKVWAESGKEAREKGTTLHIQIECFYKHHKIPDEPTPEWEQFMQFVTDHPDWNIIGTEVRVHNAKVAGTIDAVYLTPRGIVLVDWKRCKTMDFSGHGGGIGIMKHVEDCNYNKYSLQLSLYRQLIDSEVVDAYIVQMHPSLERYTKFKAQNYDIEAKELIA